VTGWFVLLGLIAAALRDRRDEGDGVRGVCLPGGSVRPVGHFDRDDSWRALLAMTDLFAWLAIDVAGRLGIPYPTSTEATVRRLIDQLHG